jgi:hypothetical protein
LAEVEELRKKYRNDAEFAIVYIKEAHTGDEWQLDDNTEGDVVYNQPNSFEARMELAKTFIDKMDVETPTLVDDIQNTAMACYAAWPERLYIIDTDGRIAYKGDMGPFGFKPEQVESYLDERFAGRGATD